MHDNNPHISNDNWHKGVPESQTSPHLTSAQHQSRPTFITFCCATLISSL